MGSQTSKGDNEPQYRPLPNNVAPRSSVKAIRKQSIQRFLEYVQKPQTSTLALYESLDYEPIINVFYERRVSAKPKVKKFWGYTGATLLIQMTSIIGGILIGLCAHTISQITTSLTQHKNSWNEHILAQSEGGTDFRVAATMFAIQCAYSCTLILLATLLILYLAPVAVGAGVTLVMQYLNGSYVHNLFSWKTLIVKFVGTALAVGANVPVGPEGPMVHIGGAITYRLLCLDFVKMGQALRWVLPCCRNVQCLKDPHQFEQQVVVNTDIIDEERLEAFEEEQNLAPAGFRDDSLPVSTDNQFAVIQKMLEQSDNKDDLEESYEDTQDNNFCITWDSLQTDREHTELVAAGAAAGLAAAFGSPIGGVLYSFEEAASYFGKKTLWRALICAFAAVYILQTLRNASYPGLIELTAVTTAYSMTQWIMQTPLLVLVCIITALMGSIYIKLREYFNDVRTRMGLLKPENKHWRIVESILLTIIFVFVAYAEAFMFGQCVPTNQYAAQYASFKDFFKLSSICGRGVLKYEPKYVTSYNDLLTLFFGVPEETIVKLISVGTGDLNEAQSLFSCFSLVVFSLTYLFFMSVISNCAIPAGLFMPSIMVGGSFGLAFGQFIQIFWINNNLDAYYPLGIVQPGVYALVGATSTLGGLFRASISLIVIIIEGTKGIDYIYGVLLAVLISNFVAKILHKEGVYETEIERRGDIHHLRQDPPRALYHQKVEDIMQADLTVLPVCPSLRQVLQILKSSRHNGYPVVTNLSRITSSRYHRCEKFNNQQPRYGRLEGLILRHQLMVLVDKAFYCDAHGNMILQEHRDNYWKYGYMLDIKMRHYFFKRHQAERVRYSPQVLHLDTINVDTTFIDLAPFMHRKPVFVIKGSYASSAHTQFVALRLRHMPVVDTNFNLIGLITRKDLDQNAGHGHWRHNPAPGLCESTSQSAQDAHTEILQENLDMNKDSSSQSCNTVNSGEISY